MNIDVIWQIAAIGILVIVVHGVIKAAGRDELALLVSLAGVAIVLWMVVRVVNELFQGVRTLFQM